MTGDIQIEDVQKQLGEWMANNTEVLSAGVYSNDIQLNQYCTTITAIKGKYPQFQSIMTRVVQGFKAEWQALGEAQMNHKMLQNYRQKVNLPLKVHSVLNTYLAKLHTENISAEEMPIAKVIIEELMMKVIDDLDELSQTAVYDSANASGEFGKSLNGIENQIANALADTTNPAYVIPLDTITDANRLDMIKKFERSLPVKTKKKITKIFVSDAFAMAYADDYETQYGRNVNYTEGGAFRTPQLKLEIVPLRYIADTTIFATVDKNMVRLIDVFDKPAVTDIQKFEYDLKIFMEWALGYDFMINQLVYVADFSGAKDKGLNNDDQNELYYASENNPAVTV
jgi:hypothetical protein